MKKQSKSRKKLSKKTEYALSDRAMTKRTFWIMLFFGIFLFIPIFIMLISLMIVQHDKLEEAALRNWTRSVKDPASRGIVYDRNGNVLAASSTVENIYIDPLELKREGEDVDAIATFLSNLIEGVEKTDVLEKAADTDRRYEVIARKQTADITDQVRAYISENDIIGIHLESDAKRYYPYGTMAAQLLGFTNAENTGASGLEAYYDSYLEGVDGVKITTKGNYETEMLYPYEKLYEATDGNNLILTVDTQVQQFLDKAMVSAVEKYDVLNGAFGIVMDVNTGEILAMTTLGSFDPNNYLEIVDERTVQELAAMKEAALSYKEGTAEYEAAIQAYYDAYNASQSEQWRNRVVGDSYEPGSTFKLITLAAALDSGSVTPDYTYYCGGSEKIEGREQILDCWKHTGHGSETLAQSLQNSCNIAFAHIGLQVGGETLYNYCEAFGLMEQTDIDLPGESSGVFHSMERMADNADYGTSYLTSTAFGQSIKVTPIQLVRAISAIVNGGYLVQPYVVSEIQDAEGNTIEKNSPTVVRQVVSAETSKLMCEMMESVVTEGTASSAKIAGYHIGGKTGTGEKLDVFDEFGNPVDDKIVSFVGVAPMNDPQYIVLIALDTPNPLTGYYVSGGIMAAPAVRDVFEDILPYLNVEPDYSDVDMRLVNVYMPNVMGMTESAASEALAEKSLSYRVVGSGDTVTAQIPSTGLELPGNSTVILYMGEEKPETKVTIPDFAGMTISQASDWATMNGIYVHIKGSLSGGNITATNQSISPGTMVDLGTTVTVEFTDHDALD